jgi:hypothetical protein
MGRLRRCGQADRNSDRRRYTDKPSSCTPPKTPVHVWPPATGAADPTGALRSNDLISPAAITIVIEREPIESVKPGEPGFTAQFDNERAPNGAGSDLPAPVSDLLSGDLP